MSTGTPVPASSSTTSTTDASSRAASTDPAAGAASQAGQSAEVSGETCSTENPLEALREALTSGDAEVAWSSYQALDDAQRSQLNEDEVRQCAVAFHDVNGKAGLDRIFADFCIAPVARMRMVIEVGIFTGTLASMLLNDADVTAADQKTIAMDPALMAPIYGDLGATAPHLVFRILAAEPAEFIAACHPPSQLADWVGRDYEVLKVVTDALGSYDLWMEAFVAHDAWHQTMSMASHEDHRGDWRDAVINGGHFLWLVVVADTPVGEERLATGLYNIIGECDGLAVEDLYLAWDCLYSLPLLREDHEQARTDTWDEGGTQKKAIKSVWHAVEPNLDAMKGFFQQFRTIPRNHINLASGLIMTDSEDVHIDNVSPPPSPEVRSFGVTTSYYLDDNTIAMQSLDAAGTPRSVVSGTWSIGEGATQHDETDIVSERTDADGNRVAMTIFENHATHEIGHAVGARRLNVEGAYNGKSGDEVAHDYAAWADGDRLEYARMLGFTDALAAAGTSYTFNVNGAPITENGQNVRDFLLQIAEGQQAYNGPAQSIVAGMMTEATLSGINLVKTVSRNGGDMPDGGYVMPFGIGGAAEVHFYCTRAEGGAKWMKYSAAAWNEKVSLYATSSWKEMFAEIYTVKYTGGAVPAGMAPFFEVLDRARPEDFADVGAPAAGPGGGGAAGGGGGVFDPFAGTRPWP